MRRSIVVLLAVLLPVAPAGAVIPDAVPNLPILGVETVTGRIVTSEALPVAPTPKVVDGDISDWTGASTRLAGTTIASRGELIYQDHLGDAWGADDGFDAERLATLHTLKDLEPRTYRVDALQQAAGDQFEAERPVGAATHYGDADGDLITQADIHEVRVAADATQLYALVRTLRMDDPADLAVMVLIDTADGGSYALPGGITSGAEWAFVATPGGVVRTIYQGDDIVFVLPPGSVAVDPSGYVNALELALPRGAFGSSPRIGVVTGLVRDGGLVPVNVAFRDDEPARIWMDERQALALYGGDIDTWLRPVDLDALAAGATQTFVQLPGYYERIYERDWPVNFEDVSNQYFQGPIQHYGVYLPKAYRPGSVLPATFWMHYRGGHAHDAAAWEPNILRAFGDEVGGIVVTPSARGTSSWYTGRGMADFLSVWDDAMSAYGIDADRVYLAGHSMGGWASYLLGLLMPDRWAASNPENGLIVPGLWTGVAPPSGAQNGGDVEAEFLYPLLENARNLPYAILHGTWDELVPSTGALAIGARYHELGYRYRVYMFHAYEHYSAPIWDDWSEVVRYMQAFRRDRDPSRVTFAIKPALDHAVSTLRAPEGVDLGLRFDKAYWVSGLRTRVEGINPSNVGRIDATTFGRGIENVLALPEAGTGAQVEPYTMHGQRWHPNGTSPAENRFEATLTNLSTATLDLGRMALSTSAPITATVTTDGPAELRLVAPDGGVRTLTLEDAGSYSIVL